MSIFDEIGIGFEIMWTDVGWCVWLIMPDWGRIYRGGFATKSEAFAWVEESYRRWKVA